MSKVKDGVYNHCKSFGYIEIGEKFTLGVYNDNGEPNYELWVKTDKTHAKLIGGSWHKQRRVSENITNTFHRMNTVYQNEFSGHVTEKKMVFKKKEVSKPIATKKQVKKVSTPIQTVKATFSNNKPIARWNGAEFVTI